MKLSLPSRKRKQALLAFGITIHLVLTGFGLLAQAPPVPGQSPKPVLVAAVPVPGPVSVALTFSANPTAAEISNARVFEEPLVPMYGDPTPAENQAFARALLAFSKREAPDDFSALTGFVNSGVAYHWTPSVLFALGWEYYHTGYYSRAINAWEDAWIWSQDETAPQAKALADRTIGELARMHSRIGGFERIGQILDEIKDRPIIGSATERITGARQALWLMQNKPEIAFRCGPLALNTIRNHLTGSHGPDKLVFESASTQQGFSLAQVRKLSDEMALGFQAAKRQPGAEIIVPCVIHWNVGHYAALIRKEGNRYLVKDPTFGNSMWISQAAVEAEASGYFLIPNGALSAGWRSVDDSEAGTIWGKGVTASSDANSTTPYEMMANSSSSSSEPLKTRSVPQLGQYVDPNTGSIYNADGSLARDEWGNGFVPDLSAPGGNALSGAKGGETLTDILAGAASRAAKTVGPGRGPVYGTQVHTAFRNEIQGLGNPNVRAEVSYLNGIEVPYGTAGSVRLDAVQFGSDGRILSVFDLKTGSATLTTQRILQIQQQIGSPVPVNVLRP